MLEFKKIDINYIDIYKKYKADDAEFACENAFANMLIWQGDYNNMIAEADGVLVVKSTFDGEEVFRLPFGKDLKKGLALIEEYCKDSKPVFWVPEGPMLEIFGKTVGDSYTFYEDREAYDYIYLREDLASLSGKRYHSKRNHINAFSKKYDWRYERITGKNIEAVKECANSWYKENADRIDRHVEFEQKGINLLLDNMEKLSVAGGAIIVCEKVVAFTLGSPINENIFDTHIEKALHDYAEAYSVINNQFALNELSSYKYINREDDMGLEGLRKAKLSYKPAILLKKYYCRPEKCDG